MTSGMGASPEQPDRFGAFRNMRADRQQGYVLLAVPEDDILALLGCPPHRPTEYAEGKMRDLYMCVLISVIRETPRTDAEGNVIEPEEPAFRHFMREMAKLASVRVSELIDDNCGLDGLLENIPYSEEWKARQASNPETDATG